MATAPPKGRSGSWLHRVGSADKKQASSGRREDLADAGVGRTRGYRCRSCRARKSLACRFWRTMSACRTIDGKRFRCASPHCTAVGE